MERKGDKAKQHTPINPMGTAISGELSFDKMEMTSPAKKPSKIGPQGQMIDGPFGGKKPA